MRRDRIQDSGEWMIRSWRSLAALIATLCTLLALSAQPVCADADFHERSGKGCKREGKHCRWDSQCCGGLVCGEDQSCKPGCRIAGLPHPSGAVNPHNACQACHPEVSTTHWSSIADGISCDDANVCTADDACARGACKGILVDCDDGDLCTVDTCEPSTGCSSARVEDGAACEEPWQGNSELEAAALSGNRLYIGGNFNWVGQGVGGGVPLDAVTGKPKRPFPKVEGPVEVALPDGTGGLYIGGSFHTVGGAPRDNLAHILADGSVSDWNPGPIGVVAALASKGGTLYVGGTFKTVGEQARNGLAAIDAVTGEVSAWNPNPSEARVFAIAVRAQTVYVGGRFATIGGATRTGLAALDVVTGNATAWNPDPSALSVPATVNTLALRENLVFVGGNFSSIGGQERSTLAAIDVTTGLATNWNPGAADNGGVSALALRGDTVYVGGGFWVMGGQPRNGIAAVNASTGLATDWDPNAQRDSSRGAVYALLVSGETIYAGGSFTIIGGENRVVVAALDAETGHATSWNPDFHPWFPNIGPHPALAMIGDTVFVGGNLGVFGGVPRDGLAVLDATSGRATDWNPTQQPPGSITGSQAVVFAFQGNTVYVGGGLAFGTVHSNIASIDATTGVMSPAWIPFGDNRYQFPFWFAATEAALYFSGDDFDPPYRQFLAAVDAVTGIPVAWDPNSNGPTAVLGADGKTVYLAGLFDTIGGQSRNGLAAVDGVTGLATPWNPQPDLNNSVLALVANGDTIYVSGGFGAIGGQARSGLAALDATTGFATPWNPSVGASADLISVRGDLVYAIGSFTGIGGQPHEGLAAIDATTGLATWFAPPSVQLHRFPGSLLGPFLHDGLLGDDRWWNWSPSGLLRATAVTLPEAGTAPSMSPLPHGAIGSRILGRVSGVPGFAPPRDPAIGAARPTVETAETE